MDNHTTQPKLNHTVIINRLVKTGDTEAAALIEYWQRRATSAAGLLMEITALLETLEPLQGKKIIRHLLDQVETLTDRAMKSLGGES